jgi:hypothetical protein
LISFVVFLPYPSKSFQEVTTSQSVAGRFNKGIAETKVRSYSCKKYYTCKNNFLVATAFIFNPKLHEKCILSQDTTQHCHVSLNTLAGLEPGYSVLLADALTAAL